MVWVGWCVWWWRWEWGGMVDGVTMDGGRTEADQHTAKGVGVVWWCGTVHRGAWLSMSAFHTIGHRVVGMGRGGYGIMYPGHIFSIRKSLHLPHTTSKITHPSNSLKNRSNSSITTEYRFIDIQIAQRIPTVKNTITIGPDHPGKCT